MMMICACQVTFLFGVLFINLIWRPEYHHYHHPDDDDLGLSVHLLVWCLSHYYLMLACWYDARLRYEITISLSTSFLLHQRLSSSDVYQVSTNAGIILCNGGIMFGG